MAWNLFSYSSTQQDAQSESLREAIRRAHSEEEHKSIRGRLEMLQGRRGSRQAVQSLATDMILNARAQLASSGSGSGAFLREYDLSSDEGVLLMCLAEALLRIPDASTADQLVRDRLSRGHWDEHLGSSESVMVNASTWGLLFSGRMLGIVQTDPGSVLQRLLERIGSPLLRRALMQAMRLLGEHFVMGSSMDLAVRRAHRLGGDLRYSYDCLGEAARSASDARRYFDAYLEAIEKAGEAAASDLPVFARPGVSIKLSALHPRYEYVQRDRLMKELVPRVKRLLEVAQACRVGLTLDAEEADRLELILDIFQAVFPFRGSSEQGGLGIAVQAYQKRALAVLQWLRHLAVKADARIPVRLVKGAYWDSEIKRAQEQGLEGYPVYTRKAATDVSYLACAAYLLEHTGQFYPQFATHNAYSLAWVIYHAGQKDYELQRLHGMGEALYGALPDEISHRVAVRVYAPVGNHEELLPYLVRRLLENGANSSFLNQLVDPSIDVGVLVADPCRKIDQVCCRPHPDIPLPGRLYGEERENSRGVDFADPRALSELETQLRRTADMPWQARPLVAGHEVGCSGLALSSPVDRAGIIGEVVEADSHAVELAMQAAHAAADRWDGLAGEARARHLREAGSLLQHHRAELVARIVREGGRTIKDAVDEVREAVDYCRYYAHCAEQEFTAARPLPGPAGELNRLKLHGRGVFACISPSNFPLAIFVGQIAAALAAGNTVVAKPARQTPLVATLAVQLLHRAGIPEDVVQLLPGSGTGIGRLLFAHPRLAGVAFPGSTETARTIQQQLARRDGPLVPLIAETGGQNALIADSSALPEQLVSDVLLSAFNSAGQRCSALRVLFVQDSIADRVTGLLCEAMQELRIGDPAQLATDVGPLIDRQAMSDLYNHLDRLNGKATLLQRLDPSPGLSAGDFFPLHVFELDDFEMLDREVFGPVLHVIRFKGSALDNVIDAVNGTGYGLTMGVHSRIESTWERISQRARVGNLYINRNMIGAVVGSQPFGGEGLSGTGPKAGGPFYLHRFAHERVRTLNTSAVGGNADLYMLSQEK